MTDAHKEIGKKARRFAFLSASTVSASMRRGSRSHGSAFACALREKFRSALENAAFVDYNCLFFSFRDCSTSLIVKVHRRGVCLH